MLNSYLVNFVAFWNKIPELFHNYINSKQDPYGILQILGISHWQSLIVFLFVVISSAILIYLIIKKNKRILSITFLLALVGSIIYILLTGFCAVSETPGSLKSFDSPDLDGPKLIWWFIAWKDWLNTDGNNIGIISWSNWEQESQDWLMLSTNIFIELVLVIVPLFIFFTIVKTLNSNRHKQIKYNNLLKSFFSIWLMPFIAITVAILMYPLIAQINMVASPGMIEDVFQDSQITTVPGIIDSAIPGSIGIFVSIEFILSVVVFSIFIGIMINVVHRHEHEKGESMIKFCVNAQMIINKYIKMVSLIIPIVLATRLPLLFDYHTLSETFIGLTLFILIFVLGWAIVISIELTITYLTMRNRSTKNFIRYARSYFTAAFVKHAAPVLLDETIKESESLGVSKDVAELTSSMSTSMGQSTCGGFYPAMIALMTIHLVIVGNDSSLGSIGLGNIITFIFVLYLIIMITNLGMTGVPGADTAVIISVLGALGLPFEYFATVFVIDGIINRVRGIANAFGFVAANNVAERVIKTKKNKGKNIVDKGIVITGEVVNEDI